MKAEQEWPWSFPERGLSEEAVMAEVMALKAQAEGSGYPRPGSNATPKLSFPGCVPSPIAVKAHQAFVELNFNNILMHTVGADHNQPTGEPEFFITTRCEREVIAMLADLCGGSLETVDGYITSGGTEGESFGILLGREWLRRDGVLLNEPVRVPIAALGQYETHYSISKALFHADIGEYPRADGSGWHMVGVTDKGAVDQDHLESKIRWLYAEKHIRHFLIVLSAGTCIGGGVDDISSIASADGLLARLEHTFGDIKFFVHVDAAFGGYVLPFLTNPIRFGFEFRYVQTIALDPHKMGQMMYDCGVFLCRKGLQKVVSRRATYIPGDDQTQRGSRSGAIAVALWAVTKHLGHEGYEQIVRRCRALAVRAQNKFSLLPGVSVVPSPMNFASFSVNWERLPVHLVRKFALRCEEVPEEFIGQANRHKLLVKIPIMPHTTEEHIETLIEAMLAEWVIPVGAAK